MDCSDVTDELITVQQMSSSSILMPVPAGAAAAAGAGAGAGRGGGAAGGGAELGRRLLLAARHGDTPAVLDLMARGAPFTTDWLGTSALHLAAANAHVRTCAVLLRAGVSRDCRTKVERTPLHMAAHAGHADVVALLLENKAAVDCRDMLQMTPLHWASARGHAAAARALLAGGADARARSKFHKTPLQLARAAGHRALADLLEAHEAAARVAPDAETPPERRTAQEAPKLPETEATERTPRPEPVKIERTNEGGGDAQAAAAAMLRRHGITLLPRDEGSTVLSALQSGRSVVLSDAGKLMLKESSAAVAPGAARGPGAGAGPKVLLTATPVKSPPQGAAVKIFTFNKKLVALPKENKAPVKKVIDPYNSSQIQYIKLPSDAKVTKSISMKAKHKPAPGLRAPADGSVLFVPEEFLTNSEPKYLRAQLLAAHRTIAQLNARLAHCTCARAPETDSKP